MIRSALQSGFLRPPPLTAAYLTRRMEMKKKILTAFMVSLLVFPFTLACWAEDAHHFVAEPDGQTAAVNPEKMDAGIRQLQEMRNRIEAELDPVQRRKLLRQHMLMMRETMSMMDAEGGMGLMGEGEPETVDADAMAIMGKKMEMMQEMMQGMALQQEMIKSSLQRKEEIFR